MSKVKYIDIREFREKGYLQELSRQFLHPLGLALEVSIDEDGNEVLGGVWDYRNDPEGMTYDESIVNSERYKNNIKRVAGEQKDKAKSRKELLGYVIQK